ncbi:MAG: T9SS type A sorting domain-containing protein [Bacteroidales bacterium]|nr:T9SS type A sorting domain-containing protein [Bacteroidales bacterium]
MRNNKVQCQGGNGKSVFFNESRKLFPNPFSTSVTLEWDQNIEIERIEMLNMLGETVMVIGQVNPGGQVIIQRGNLPVGIYFLRVHADRTYMEKIMIR